MGPSRQADLVVAMLPHMIATARILRPEFRRLSHARYLKHNEFTVHVEIIDIDGRDAPVRHGHVLHPGVQHVANHQLPPQNQ